MKTGLLLSFFILSLPVLSFTQERRNDHGYDKHRVDSYCEPGSALSVFSENGDRFLLIINDIRQNTFPQARVRIEGLPQVTNEVQIIFDDNRTQAIQKRITFSDPVEGKAINL